MRVQNLLPCERMAAFLSAAQLAASLGSVVALVSILIVALLVWARYCRARDLHQGLLRAVIVEATYCINAMPLNRRVSLKKMTDVAYEMYCLGASEKDLLHS